MKTRVLLTVALLGVGAVAADAAQNDVPKKVSSFYGSVKFEPETETDPPTFSGRVAPSPCRKGRSVSVSGVGADVTDARGRFSVASTFSGPFEPSGRFKVVTAEKVIRQGSTKIICKATSRTIRIKASDSSQPRRGG